MATTLLLCQKEDSSITEKEDFHTLGEKLNDHTVGCFEEENVNGNEKWIIETVETTS